MTQNVVYFNRGTKCIIRLLVSIFSLRKHYKGNVILLQEGSLDSWVGEYLTTTFGVTIIQMAELKESISSLFRKTTINTYLPCDSANIYLDSDTIVKGSLDDLFTTVETHKLVFTNFADWHTTGRKIGGRIDEWKKVIGNTEHANARGYGPAVNTGVFGFVVDDETQDFFEEWVRVCRAGAEKHCTPKMLDELAAQVILHKYDVYIADPKWNHSVKYGGDNHNPVIVHFHGMKHVGEWTECATWKSLYWEMRNQSPYYDKLGNASGDRRFKNYLNSVVKSDLTIVTAFDAVYHDRTFSNFQKWMDTEGLREQKYVIFYNGFRSLAKETRGFRKYKNVRFVAWELPHAQSKREEMLSCFVLAVPKEIKTRYWMKLDGDCKPKVSKFVFPEYDRYTIVAHPWGYTKMKADPAAKKHWLNTLDDWWGKTPIFKETYDPLKQLKVRHSRYCSFCYFEKTDFTTKLAERCGDRLPIPSQDTLTWYVSTQQKEPVLCTNMKDQIRSA